MNLNTGINENKKKEIAHGLSRLLADTSTIFLKTYKYHWNVTGPMFQPLHSMFKLEYTELSAAMDQIAERIRVMDVKAPGSFSEFLELSSVKDDTNLDVPANTMISTLLNDHEQIVKTAKVVLSNLVGANDEGTSSLLGTRIEYHEKTAWMLKSLIE